MSGAALDVVVFDGAADSEALAEALTIRREVFINEQAVPEAEEMDGLEDVCAHLLALKAGEALATARLRRVTAGWKIQRVAVRATARGTGVGAAILRAAVDEIKRREPGAEILLDSQTHALEFYERLGFAAEGDEFLDAGIPHRRMRLRRAP